MLSNKNCVLLRSLLSSSSNDKGNTRHKTEKLWTPVHKAEEEQVRIALVDAGRGWDAVKRECVLLKRKG